MSVRVELHIRRYGFEAQGEVETICAVSGEARDYNVNAAIRSAIGDLLRLRPDAIGCIKAAADEQTSTPNLD